MALIWQLEAYRTGVVASSFQLLVKFSSCQFLYDSLHSAYGVTTSESISAGFKILSL